MDKKLIILIIINLVIIFSLLYISYIVTLGTLKKNNKKPITLLNYINRGEIPSLKNLLIGLIFGLIFGFIDNFGLWLGIDVLYKYIPGGTLTKAAWGNTYSDVFGVTAGSFIAEMAKNYFNYDDDNQPIWLNSVGIFFGCVLGLLAGRLLTNRN